MPTTIQLCLRAGLLAAWGCVCLCPSGCTPSSAGEAEKLEHHTPTHQPASFALAVEQLGERVRDLEQPTTTEEYQQQWTEFLDIVRWLPELAGDSDLQRADWELVQHASQDLERRLQPQPKDSPLASDVAEFCQAQLAQLQPLVGRSTSIPEPGSR